MRKFVRQLMPGQEFTLVRTGECYKFMRRDYSTPSGTRYVCLNLGPMPIDQDQERETSLHHPAMCGFRNHENPALRRVQARNHASAA